MKTFSIPLIIFLIISLSACSSVSMTPEADNPEVEPFVLFWTKYPTIPESMNHVTPQVWIREGDKYSDTPAYEQTSWIEHGVIPLRWAGGNIYALERGPEDLSKYWSSFFEKGFAGIAIDELGGSNRRIHRVTAEALRLTREKQPDAKIVVWHAGLLSGTLARAYRDTADIVILERYVSGKNFSWFKFGLNLTLARMYGIENKSVFGLGINDAAPAEKQARWGKWANSPEELEAQISWIRENAPEMPGIAFFASDASEEMIRTADSLVSKYYPSWE